MRRLIMTLSLGLLVACSSVVYEENAVEICETALLRNMVATSMVNQHISMASSMTPEDAAISILVQATAVRASLQQAIGPNSTIAEYCESKDSHEIRSMEIDSETAIVRYAVIRGIPRTVAEDQVDRILDQMDLNAVDRPFSTDGSVNEEIAERDERAAGNQLNYHIVDLTAEERRLIDQYFELADACLGAGRRCAERDGVSRALRQNGICYGPPDRPTYLYRMYRCAVNVPAGSRSGGSLDPELDLAVQRTLQSGDWSSWARAECYRIGNGHGPARAQCIAGTVIEDDRTAGNNAAADHADEMVRSGLEIARRLEAIGSSSRNPTFDRARNSCDPSTTENCYTATEWCRYDRSWCTGIRRRRP